MEIALNRRALNCFKKVSDYSAVCDTSAECVVPDVQEDIHQILTTSFVTKIRSKDIDFEEVSIKAELNAVVMYSSEKGIEKLNVTLPVSVKLPAKDVDSSCTVNADIKVTSWDLRTVNPRKVSLKAEVCVKVSCYRENEFVWYDKPEELPEKLFIKTDVASMRIIDTVGEKTVTANEEFDLAEGDECELISAFASYHTESSEAVGEKLVVRCRADIEVVFLSGGKLSMKTFSMPFSQLFDVGGESSGEHEVVILSTGEYYDVADGKFSAEVHAVIQMVYYKSVEISYASDAYSCNYETVLQSENVEFCSESNLLSLKDGIKLNFDSQYDISEVLMTKAYFIRTEMSEDGINALVGAELIYRDADNEVYCGKIRGNVKYPLDNCDKYKVQSAEITNIRAVSSGKSIDFSADVRLCAKCEEYRSISCVSNIEVGEAISGASSSAYIVFSEDDLWDIAKKYRSSCDKIIRIDSEGKKKLFVPVVR